MAREIRKPELGVVAFADLFEDLKFFPHVVTKGQGSRTLSEPGYFFLSISRNGRSQFNRRVDNREYMLYAKPTQLMLDTFAPVEIDGLSSFEIIANECWERDGGALVIAADRSFISRQWIGLVPFCNLPDVDQVQIGGS